MIRRVLVEYWRSSRQTFLIEAIVDPDGTGFLWPQTGSVRSVLVVGEQVSWLTTVGLSVTRNEREPVREYLLGTKSNH